MSCVANESSTDCATQHYVLYTDTSSELPVPRWSFVLRGTDGSQRFWASDDEPNVQGERLELLAVVRGLEAVEHPSRITLVTPSRYVDRGLNHGLEQWRSMDWQWEYYGRMVQIKDHDLWQRLDRATQIHDVQCRRWRVDAAHRPLGGPHQSAGDTASKPHVWPGVSRRIRRGKLRLRRWSIERTVALWLAAAQLGTGLLPSPWLE
jgi:ribonuclease HI